MRAPLLIAEAFHHNGIRNFRRDCIRMAEHAGFTLPSSRQATRHHHWRLDVGALFTQRSCARSAGTRRLRALERRTGRPRRRHHHASGTAGGAGSERRRHPRSRHRGAQAHRDRPARPRHRRAAAAADPHLVGPPAAAAARDHRRARYHLGWNFERVEQDGSGVRVHFSGGRVEHADILVGGDGIRSTVRAQVAPELQPVYAGYYIWRGAPNEADLAAETLKEIFPYSCSTCRSARKSSPIRSRASTTICGRATAATISSGIASPTPQSCAR